MVVCCCGRCGGCAVVDVVVGVCCVVMCVMFCVCDVGVGRNVGCVLGGVQTSKDRRPPPVNRPRSNKAIGGG